MTPNKNEDKLIALVKDRKDSVALTELIDMHSGIYINIVSEYANIYPNLIKKSDLSDDRLYNIYQFILDYQNNRNMKLGTYIGERTDYLCKSILRKEKHNPLSPSMLYQSQSTVSQESEIRNVYSSTTLGGDNYGTVGGNNSSISEAAYDISPDDAALKGIDLQEVIRVAKTATICNDTRFVTILELRHLQNPSLTWRQIGKRLKLSYEMCRKIYKKNMAIVRETISSSTS